MVDSINFFNKNLVFKSSFKELTIYSTQYINIQGELLKIIDATGVVKVSYQYDAYGNMVITDHTSINLGTINPYRYRGYRYDEESKLYYLQSRYYNQRYNDSLV